MILCFFSSGRPALSSKEKNQCTHPGFGSSFSSSLISCGVPSSHSGRGLSAIDIFLVHVKAWIIRVKGCHKIITAHRCFTNKINIRCIDLIDVQASVLATQCILPLALVSIANHEDNLVSGRRMKQDVWHLVFSGSIAFVFCQYSEIIQNAKVFVDDILFCSSRITLLPGYAVSLVIPQPCT